MRDQRTPRLDPSPSYISHMNPARFYTPRRDRAGSRKSYAPPQFQMDPTPIAGIQLDPSQSHAPHVDLAHSGSCRILHPTHLTPHTWMQRDPTLDLAPPPHWGQWPPGFTPPPHPTHLTPHTWMQLDPTLDLAPPPHWGQWPPSLPPPTPNKILKSNPGFPPPPPIKF